MTNRVPLVAKRNIFSPPALCINQRWEIVRESRRCRKCLRVSHHTNDCKRADGTSCDKCKKNHHRSLHDEKKNDSLQSNLSPNTPPFISQSTPPEVEENRNIQGRDNEEIKDVRDVPGVCPVQKGQSQRQRRNLQRLTCHVGHWLEHKSSV